MTTKYYTIIFEGKIKEGCSIESVKDELRTLFKADDKEIERLFSGGPVAVLKDAEYEKAMKFMNAFDRAGALCRIEGVEDADNSAEHPPEIPPVNSAESVQVKTMLCPQCNYEQQENEECLKCGTIISKFNHTTKKKKIFNPNYGEKMILTTIETIPGQKIVEHFGLVSGSTIRAKHIGRDFMASLKNIVGGELKGYTELLNESRRQSVERMKEQARQLGGNAIVNVRFSTSSVAQGAAELYAYGTAVRVEQQE